MHTSSSSSSQDAYPLMTQQEQREFSEGLEAALCWMQAIQERLRTNDNTQGPRAALEARLRETEVWDPPQAMNCLLSHI